MFYKTIILILFGTLTCIAQTGKLQGIITSNGNPLVGTNILIMETTLGGVSDNNGFYKVENIPVGNQRIRISAIGYKTQFKDVTIVADRSLELDIDLAEEIIQVGEVKVIGNKVQEQSDTRVSLIDLNPKAARVLPGAVTDVFRTLQALPGVLAVNDFSSQLVIRGSGPDQNLIIMDDVEIFNPYRLYGVVSMFNPEAVSNISLITGGFPAKYGDRLSAVLDIQNKEGTTTENIKGNINASIVSANVVLEGKNPFGIGGSWLLNSRRTYYDLLLEPFVKNSGLVDQNVTFPNFFDIQGKLVLGPFKNHKFILNGIYSRDGVNLISSKDREQADSIAVIDDSKNDLASMAWHFSPNKSVLNKVIVSWYRNGGDTGFDSQFLDPSLNRDAFNDVSADTLAPYLLGFGFKSKFTFSKYSFDDKLTYLWGKKNALDIGAGFDVMKTDIAFDFSIDPQLKSFFDDNPNFRAVFDNISNSIEYSRYRAYVDNRFQAFGKFFIQPGLRYDYYNILRKGYLAPRLSLSYAINNLSTIRAVWGIYYQSPGYEKIRDQNVLYNFDRTHTDPLESEKSVHYVLSYERWMSEEWRAKAEVYYKDFTDLINPQSLIGTSYHTEALAGKDPRYVDGWSRPVPIIADSLTQNPVNNSTGDAYGFEFILEKKNVRGENIIDGWISYSLAWTNRKEMEYDRPFQFDQRHTINLVLNYKINDWLDFGMRFQYGSGFAYTEAIGITPRIVLEDRDGDRIPETPVISTRKNSAGNEEVIYNLDFGGLENRNAGRRPEYHRLDLRLNAKADYWDLDWVFYLDIINVYNRTNVLNYEYFVTDDLKLGSSTRGMLPILPTFGFIVRF